MKTNLKIESIEEKTSKAGRLYKSFKTTEGTMTCFEVAVVKVLEANLGKLITCEVEERNGFKNITAFKGLAVSEEKIGNAKPFAIEANGRQASVIISYVKDMVCAGKMDLKDFNDNSRLLMELHKELSK